MGYMDYYNKWLKNLKLDYRNISTGFFWDDFMG